VVVVADTEVAVQRAEARPLLVVDIGIGVQGGADPHANAHAHQAWNGIDHPGVVSGGPQLVVGRGLGPVEADLHSYVGVSEGP